MIDQVKTININDKEYPTLLKLIPNPPINLYYIGTILPNKNCFAIVGARNCSIEGKKIAFKMAKELSKYFTIVSGLALGVDSFSHTATVEEKKRTIAILGTGLSKNVIYPKENLKLSENIVRTGGCLISEYPLNTRGSKKTFPERNRIISGISLAILAIEAKERSGTAITIRKALEQNKKVFTINSFPFAQTIPIKTSRDILKEIKNEFNYC